MVTGHKVAEGFIDGIKVIAHFTPTNVENTTITTEFTISKTCNVEHFKKTVLYGFKDIVPDTVVITYTCPKDGKTKKLNNFNNKTLLQQDLGFINETVVKVTGSYFPISMFKGLEFAQNAGIYMSTDCLICLKENMKNVTVFDCGHANVCSECAINYPNKKLCPLCINNK